jgi:hypothetical protein
MAIADTVAPRFEMGRVLKRTFSVISDNLATFALLSLVPGASVAALSAGDNVFEDSAGLPTLPDLNTILLLALGGLFYLASAVILQAGVVHGAIASLNGRRASIGDCLATGLRNLVPLFVITFLATLGMLAGAILLLVPGVILVVIWSVVAPARVVEHTSVFGAFSRSAELTRGYRWPILGVYVAFVVLMVTISVMFQVLYGIGGVAGASTAIRQIAEAGSTLLSSMITGIISSTFAASIYYELRQLKEGIGPEALASVFD